MIAQDAKRDSRIRSSTSVIIVAGWLLYGLFFASQGYLSQVYWGREASWKQSLLIWMPCALAWMLLTPAMLYLARRFPFAKRNWWRPLLIHAMAASFFSLFALAVYILIRKVLIWNDPTMLSPITSLKSLAVGEFHVGLLIYTAVTGIHYALGYYRKYRERELAAAQLESQLAQARLEALRKQLQPHFLFNTLNTVAILIDEDTRAARTMLVRLSDLLRATLDRSKAHEVSLKQELEFIEGYLEIERTRFQDRLTVEMAVDPKTLDARVPDLLLQPIVENAIRHGIAPRSAPGHIEIRAERRNGSLHLQVRDNGAGLQLAERATAPGGLGIANTRARLAQLYGAHQSFTMQNLEGGGLLVDITLPFHTHLAEASAEEMRTSEAGRQTDEEDRRPDR